MADSKTTLTWMSVTQAVNAPRISDELWEQLKEVILKLYKDNTLDYVREYMRKNYGFNATLVPFSSLFYPHRADISPSVKKETIHPPNRNQMGNQEVQTRRWGRRR